MKGQINLDSAAGKLISQISSREDVKNIVEIGTWNGMGSTACVLDGVKNKKDFSFISLECNQNMYNQAVRNNKGKPVDILLGRIIDPETGLDLNDLSHEEKFWAEQDMKDYVLIENVINKLPEKIDFLILDGGEFSTREEMCVLEGRYDYIFLDDTRIRKNAKNRRDLFDDPSFVCILDHINERNGWAVFKRA